MLLVVLASTTRVTETGGLTAIAFVVIAIFAALVIAGILYGAQQKRARAAGEEDEKQRAAEMGAQDDAEPAAARPAAAEVEPPAVAVDEPAPAPNAKPAARPEAAPTPAASAPAAKPAPAPRADSVPAPAVAGSTAPEPSPAAFALTDVKGLGPKAVPLLAACGVADIAALAALDPDRAAEVDGRLGALSGRLTRDRWVDQARLLAAGDVAAFEATYGKL